MTQAGGQGTFIYKLLWKLAGGERERENYTFVVVPVVSVEARLMCVCVCVCLLRTVVLVPSNPLFSYE